MHQVTQKSSEGYFWGKFLPMLFQITLLFHVSLDDFQVKAARKNKQIWQDTFKVF